MKHNVNYFRLIEEYFDGNLSKNEELMLFDQLQKDPLLKAEYDLQSDIVTGLKNERKLQLKQSLDAVEIPAPAMSLTHGKWILSSASMLVLISFGIWLNATKEESVWPVLELPNENHIVQAADNSWELYDHTQLAIETRETDNQLREDVGNTIIESESNNTTAQKGPIENIAVASEPEAISFENEANFQAEEEELPLALSAENDFNSSNANAAASVEVKLENQKGQVYQYKYYNNKLFLFGDFENKPYELLEVVNQKRRNMYLFHNDKVYYIKHNTLEKSNLPEITNSEILEELNYIKNNQ